MIRKTGTRKTAIGVILIALCLAGGASAALAGERGYFGASFGNLPATGAVHTGVVVKKVFAGMAAERAGLKPGEIVTQIDGVSPRDPRTAVALLAENAAGERVRLTVIDAGEDGLRRATVFVTLGDEPTSDFARIMTAKPLPPPRHVPASATAVVH